MDNKSISVQSEGKNSFDLAVKLFFLGPYDKGEPMTRVSHYIETEGGLAFLWHADHKNSIKLPVALDWQGAANLAWEWLIQQPDSKYKEPFDGDGSSDKGFKVYNEVYRDSYILFIVEPIWAWHGK